MTGFARPRQTRIGRGARAAGLALGLAIAVAGSLVLVSAPSLLHLGVAAAAWFTAIVVHRGARRLAAVVERTQADVAVADEAFRHSERARREEIARLRAAVGGMLRGACVFDADGRLTLSNDRYTELYDLPHDGARLGMSVEEVVKARIAAGNEPAMGGDQYVAAMAEIAARREAAETIIEQTDGRIMSIRCEPLADGGWMVTHEDITKRVRADAKIAYMERHDLLTDILNRAAFTEALERAIEVEEAAAVLVVGLDRLKTVNDSLGHDLGDLLLRKVAQRLTGCAGSGDVTARLGGDEFAVLRPGMVTAEEAAALAQSILAAIAEPYDLEGEPVAISASAGIALAAGHGHIADFVLRNAGMALDRAKAEWRGSYRFFEPATDVHVQELRALEAELRTALAGGRLTLHYQPIVELRSGRVTRLEALVRWNSPTRGDVAPANFLPLSETAGLAVPLAEWSIGKACKEAAQWPINVRVAVNLSPAQLMNAGLRRVVADALAESGLSAKRLELEITEAALTQDSEGALAKMQELRSLGIRISLDDFGTGCSAFGFLQRFPFDGIKIDHTFTQAMTGQDHGVGIVQAVSALGRSLGMTTTAEGVETPEQLRHVKLEGCDEVQGLLLCPPLPGADVGEWLRQRNGQLREVA